MPSDAITSPPEPRPLPAAKGWVDLAVDDLERVTREASPALRARMEAALGRVAGMNGGGSLREALLRPASTPFVKLVDACAHDLGLSGDPRAGLLGRSMILLYLYVRVQDDVVDEPDRVDRASVYAAEAFLAEHLALYAAAVSSPAAMAWRGRIMRRFAEVAADEVDERGQLAPSDADLGWMGEKFLPMAVPRVGMALAAGRDEAIALLVSFVQEIGTALQLVNDVYNVAEDAALARPTPVIRWLREADVDTGASTLRATLLSHPVRERALGEAKRRADRATALARGAGFARLAAIGEQVGAMVDGAPQRLLQLMLGLSV
jgi:hypothetical protein